MILQDDALTVLRTLPAESVPCCASAAAYVALAKAAKAVVEKSARSKRHFDAWTVPGEQMDALRALQRGRP